MDTLEPLLRFNFDFRSNALKFLDDNYQHFLVCKLVRNGKFDSPKIVHFSQKTPTYYHNLIGRFPGL